MLYTKEEIENHANDLELWQLEVYQQFSNMMTQRENPYPCVPGIQGFMKNMLRFGFVGDPRTDESTDQLALLLKQYGEISRATGNYASLVIFCDTRTLLDEQTTMDEYEEVFWTLLNVTHSKDPSPWPENIPKNPEDPAWEFCFNGEPYFAFCATPVHKLRNSRSFPCMLLAFQPRWVFDEINDSTPFGRKIKKVIRKRLEEYDGIPTHPALKWYGQKDNHEWKQYFLKDDDSSLSKCPFMALKNKWKSLRP
ncbi:YqcI/YcgG family protein [Halobacillus sp. Nhm2S1]|uniref:YqcI/YcgG family protein n=1 Tax=Halobacillus sp. Nhm2S1 TaxID=2866716 RepID=UPI001C730DFE|nr:YqcI/YcgG family protein [Halobacillus sp. Nhm2S1]MBX0357446.1 YqcI/YcgG family protein [Halobacillus sp. Nhm2S1]